MEALDLSGQVWQEIDRRLASKRSHRIQILTVRNSSLASIPFLPWHIQILDLSKNHIERITGLNELKQLKVLNLCRNEIRRIECLTRNVQLEELYLSHNVIREIENMEHLLNLHTLDIRYNKLSSTDSIRRLEESSNLQNLSLDGNEFAQRLHHFRFVVFDMFPNLLVIDGENVTDILEVRRNNRAIYKPKMNSSYPHRNINPRVASASNRSNSNVYNSYQYAGDNRHRLRARGRRMAKKRGTGRNGNVPAYMQDTASKRLKDAMSKEHRMGFYGTSKPYRLKSMYALSPRSAKKLSMQSPSNVSSAMAAASSAPMKYSNRGGGNRHFFENDYNNNNNNNNNNINNNPSYPTTPWTQINHSHMYNSSSATQRSRRVFSATNRVDSLKREYMMQHQQHQHQQHQQQRQDNLEEQIYQQSQPHVQEPDSEQWQESERELSLLSPMSSLPDLTEKINSIQAGNISIHETQSQTKNENNGQQLHQPTQNLNENQPDVDSSGFVYAMPVNGTGDTNGNGNANGNTTTNANDDTNNDGNIEQKTSKENASVDPSNGAVSAGTISYSNVNKMNGMKDVIKKLNEKINKLYNWHLVEIDLVSKQQMQLNEIRTELDSTKESMQNIAASAVATRAQSTIGDNVKTPTKMVIEANTDSVNTVSTQKIKNINNYNHIDNNNTNNSDNNNNSNNNYDSNNDPQLIRSTLKKCFEILQRENAPNEELNAVDAIVKKLESDIDTSAQLSFLDQFQPSLVDNNEDKSIGQKNQSITNQESEASNKNKQNNNILTTPKLVIDESSEQTRSSFIKPQIVNGTIDKAVLFSEKLTKYNNDIERIEADLDAITEPHSETIAMQALTTNYNDKSDKISTSKNSTACVKNKSRANSVSSSNIGTRITPADVEAIDAWLSELSDELNTTKLSLQHLMSITSSDCDNIQAKVKEFNSVATNCDMFAEFDIPNNIVTVIPNLSVQIQKQIEKHLTELRDTKKSIQSLMSAVLHKNKHSINSNDDQNSLIEAKRREITSKHFLSNNQYKLSVQTMSAI